MSGKKPDDSASTSEPRPERPLDFIRQAITEDLKAGKCGRVHTRFPPEPNAYAHIGHAKASFLNYNMARDFGGLFNLRFDDTNPLTEEQQYVDALIEDLRWVGVDWGDRLFFASDYFEQMYQCAVQLVRQGDAYVDSLSAEQVSAYRGSWTAPGRNSPHRDRSVAENLDLFARMRAGEFPNGAHTLRARIDMAHPNQNMRDPIMYRILHARHYRTGDAWCIYPSYDWAHGLEDSIEGITHSLCSIEFENHRPLYDWFLDRLGIYHPRQIEFGRLNLANTVMSKRKIIGLVREGCVKDFDDPRLHTLRALRRRGYTPEGIQNFLGLIGISKTTATAEVAMLEHGLREDLNKRSPRVMAVLRPLKVVIDNYPDGKVEELDAVNNPEDATAGTRKVPFSRVIYIEQDDFMEEPPAKFYRLAPGREVRLRYAYFVTCARVVKDAAGRVVELRCTYDPATRGGDSPDGRKVKATLHWVSAAQALDAEVRLYDQLLRDEKGEAEEVEAPEDGAGAATQEAEWKDRVNPDSLQVLTGCKVEPSVADKAPGWRCQFERLGYFCMDPDSAPGRPVFNRTATLKDEWSRIQKRGGR